MLKFLGLIIITMYIIYNLTIRRHDKSGTKNRFINTRYLDYIS